MHLDESESRRLGERAARCEARTGTQVALAVVGKCDAYPEIPWKAFALATSASAALGVLAWQPGAVDAAQPGLLAAVVAFLGAGAVAALAAVFLPPFARLFLAPGRRDEEMRQYADSFFLAENLVRTRRRCAVLILVGLFERGVVVRTDVGLQAALGEADLAALIARMRPLLAAGRVAPALEAGVEALEALLVARGFAGDGDDGGDEIEREVFEARGA